jgi:hypothetical protein
MRFASLSLTLPATAIVAQMIACGDASGPAKPPASIVIVSGNAQVPTEVGTRLALPLQVKVLDDQGGAIRGVSVGWSTTAGSFAAPTSVTDRSGVATTEWTLGPTAGNQSATAAVAGKSVVFRQAAVAGPLDQIILGRDTVLLLGVGDGFRLSARAADRFGNDLSIATKVEVTDSSVVSIQNLGNGAFLTALVADKKTTVIATARAVTKTGTVVVMPPPCRSGALVATLAIGEMAVFAGPAASEFCVSGTTAGAEFIAVPFYSDFTGSLLRLSISTGGTTTNVTNRMAPGFQMSVPPLRIQLRRDERFEMELRERSQRELSPLIPMARAAAVQSGGRLNLNVALPQIGDLLNLNTNSSSTCSSPKIRTGRVVAITNGAIVVADTANPANGFTTEDYQYFGAGFDTLVYPVDTLSFGAPTDKDGNQRVILFFTRAVNELTPPGQSFYIGGFFFNRDLFPKTTTGAVQGCEASNFAEMFYLLVPDPNGVVNQNARSVEFVREVMLGTLAHELQHLINSSRHLYINSSNTFEEVFLDEGLSHIAEELAFFRASGLSARQNIDYETIQSSSTLLDAFNTFQVPNLRRFREFLLNPLTNSPYASSATIATRGGIWAFLRYAADRRGGDENQLWMQLANPPADVRGLANLNRAVTTDLSGWVRDWSVANYADDFITGLASVVTEPSWNIRSVVTVVNEGMWALDTQAIDSANIATVAIGDGSAAYFRFGVGPGAAGGGRITARATTVPNSFSLTVIRTK